MSASLLTYGIFCRDGNTTGAVTVLLSATSFGGSSIDAASKYMAVSLAGYSSSAIAYTHISAVEWGDGTNWQSMTRSAYYEYAPSQCLGEVWTLDAPNVSYDRFRITTTQVYEEGFACGFVTAGGAGTVTLVDAACDYKDGGPASVTLTGGAAGDLIYIQGADFGSPDITINSQTQLDSRDTSCAGGIGNQDAYKDWSSGATCGMGGYYVWVNAVAFNDSGAGGITIPVFYHNQQIQGIS